MYLLSYDSYHVPQHIEQNKHQGLMVKLKSISVQLGSFYNFDYTAMS